MEKVYRKKENGRYEPIGYNTPDISDGIWLVKSDEGSKSCKSLVWRVGETKDLKDVVTLATLIDKEDLLTNYLMRLREEDSEEYKEAKKKLGGYLKDPVVFYNISAADLVSLFLDKLSGELEKPTKTTTYTALRDFMEKQNLNHVDSLEKKEILLKFEQYLTNNNLKIQ